MSGAEVKIVELPGHFSQVQLAGLKTIVDHHVVDGHAIQFDATEMDRIDGAAVQFLLSVSAMQKAADNHGVMVVNSNQVLKNALNDMGVADLIKIDSVDTPAPETPVVDE
ncbi:MAG: STAS domain-containing protein [Granulosicoccus sp.]